MSNLVNFPKWRQNSTAIEKLREVLQYAEARPEHIQRVIVIFENQDHVRQIVTDSEVTVVQALGMIDLAKNDLMKEM
ncbi:MAG: hypothetical protein ACYDHZ_08080 [Dehalococcoidia bacterium]